MMSNPGPIPEALRLHELSLNKSGEYGFRKFIPFKRPSGERLWIFNPRPFDLEWNSCAGSSSCFVLLSAQKNENYRKPSKCTMAIYPTKEEISQQKVSWRFSSEKSHFTRPFSCFSRKWAFFRLFQFCLYSRYCYWWLTLCTRIDYFGNKVLFAKA